jgi:hypothetical protein
VTVTQRIAGKFFDWNIKKQFETNIYQIILLWFGNVDVLDAANAPTSTARAVEQKNCSPTELAAHILNVRLEKLKKISPQEKEISDVLCILQTVKILVQQNEK